MTRSSTRYACWNSGYRSSIMVPFVEALYDPLVRMGSMFQPNGSTIECDTCVAANTSACGECIVSYILANDAGPIEYVPAPEPVEIRPIRGTVEAVLEMFVQAGLVADPVEFVPLAEFERGDVRETVGGAVGGASRR